MADTKITGLGELAETPNDADLIHLVDVSDTTMSANGTNKKVTKANLVGGLSPTGHTHTESDITDLGTYATQSDVEEPWVDIDRLGFVDRTESTLSFDDTTYTLTLTDAGAGWSYYRNGVKYTISGNKTSTIAGSPPTAGIYYFYIDANDGTITNSTAEWSLRDDKVPICTVYWDNTATPKYWISDERHSVALDRAMHYYIHTVEGAKIVTVPTLSGYTIDTDTDASKAFGISAGTLLDQDILHTLGALTDPDGLSADYVIWYRTSSTTWSWKYSIMPFDYTSSGYINYDNAGTQTEGQASKWYNTYLVATNATGDARYVFISGRSEFSSLANAQAEDVASFDWTGLEITEGVILYRLTWNTSNSYSSTGKCRLDIAPVALEIATSGVTAGGGIDHNSLANLQGGTTAEFYHLTSAELASVGTALQPTDIASGTITARTGAVDLSGGSDGDVLTVQADGSLAVETPAGGGGGGDYVSSGSLEDLGASNFTISSLDCEAWNGFTLELCVIPSSVERIQIQFNGATTQTNNTHSISKVTLSSGTVSNVTGTQNNVIDLTGDTNINSLTGVIRFGGGGIGVAPRSQYYNYTLSHDNTEIFWGAGEWRGTNITSLKILTEFGSNIVEGYWKIRKGYVA